MSTQWLYLDTLLYSVCARKTTSDTFCQKRTSNVSETKLSKNTRRKIRWNNLNFHNQKFQKQNFLKTQEKRWKYLNFYIIVFGIVSSFEHHVEQSCVFPFYADHESTVQRDAASQPDQQTKTAPSLWTKPVSVNSIDHFDRHLGK